MASDRYRQNFLREAFEAVGIPYYPEPNGGISHNLIAPKISYLFAERKIVFGDDILLRWYIGNVYTRQDRMGNRVYEKIEPERGKTDGWFAFPAGMIREAKAPLEAPLVLTKDTFKVMEF